MTFSMEVEPSVDTVPLMAAAPPLFAVSPPLLSLLSFVLPPQPASSASAITAVSTNAMIFFIKSLPRFVFFGYLLCTLSL